jgi:hypothetical protein
VLHLTNGDCAIEPIRAAGVEGEILPWRENLLEVRVPRGHSPAEHDERLERALAEKEPVMLWFEADLFEPLAAGTPPLPAVGDTLHRLLEELPWADTGLSRTERQLLEALAGGARSREEAFMATMAAEDRPFGDVTALAALDRLAPLLDGMDLTEGGRAVLAGDEHWQPSEERWLGGTHIPPGPPPWLWDAGTVRAGR